MDSSKMTAVWITVVLHSFFFCFVSTLNTTGEIKTASACYGTHENFLKLECPNEGEVISAEKVLYGAKPSNMDCPTETTENNYKPECCIKGDDDCVILIAGETHDPYTPDCSKKQKCTILTTWLPTSGQCSDPKKYATFTNFKEITYTCVKDSVSKPGSKTPSTTKPITSTTTTKPTTKKVTAPVTSTPRPVPTEGPPGTRSMPRPKTSPRTSSTFSSTGVTGAIRMTSTHKQSSTKTAAVKSSESASAVTSAMMGGMAAAIIGLILTISGFIFYWGRRKQKQTATTKPNTSTVWDFLLAHTLAVRSFRRGYDNFGSTRSSVSSEGDNHSPATGKTTWLPNITVDSINTDTHSVTSDDNCSTVDIHVPDRSDA